MAIKSDPSLPLATYRLQLNKSFRFDNAREIVPYLHALGISDCYLSPVTKSMPGSEHGYDTIDLTMLDPELGTQEDFTQFVEAAHAHRMSLLVDVVPNHMGIGKALNRWWRDVLENGPSARYATAFDIDWHPIKQELNNKVLLPILGDQYGTVLENQEMMVEFHQGELSLRYGEHQLPLTPKSWIAVLGARIEVLVGRMGESDGSVMELQSILTALRNLPDLDETDQARIAERYREVEIVKKRLALLTETSPPVEAHIRENVTRLNGSKGEPETFDELDALLDAQAYRLASWKVASEEINYRRFFDINDLAAIRMENPMVFQESHELLMKLIRDGMVTGVRVDHVDGLYDPGAYLRQLQDLAKHPDGGNLGERELFLVVEKILGKDEVLPDTWPVHGTTGYDFMNLVNGLFVQTANERVWTEIYSRFIDRETSYSDLAYASKQLIMRASMASELNVLGHRLNMLSERDRRSRDFTLNSLTHAIREIIACFPVYRTYATEGPEPVAERDRAYIHMAVARAKRRNPALTGQVFDFIRSILLKQRDARTAQDREDQVRFVMKFQQITSPVTAKGIEDTAFYRYNRLVSLNEVGGELEQFGLPIEEFHKRMRERQARWPHAMSASSTHDTKRSEDVRARLNLLSEIPQEWKTKVNRWSRMNRKHRRETEGERQPDRNDEYLFYQTLVGAWPLQPMDEEAYRVFCGRIQRYMEKAIHEAKVNTSWVNPSFVYDQAMQDFVGAALDRTAPNAFLEDFLPFQVRLAHCGLFGALSQLLLKMTAPGIPDFYQGTELWDFSLVDPDNRRPVDYKTRHLMLNDLRRAMDTPETVRPEWVHALANEARDGRLKLFTMMATLEYRRVHTALFERGDYVPLETGGAQKQHLCAFARVHETEAVVTVVPRFLYTLMPEATHPPLGSSTWEDSWVAVPPWPTLATFQHVLTGEVVASESVQGRRVLQASKIFEHCPLGLLERTA
ncbi:MAG: malto-oligosyltrehalose synthase [Nitrospiraceae bacterium]|nr:malto-oligosyltrehalose synthase [Nitrospiraceae bacterium]